MTAPGADDPAGVASVPQHAIESNLRAVRWYEENAEYYDSLIDPEPSPNRREALERIVARVPADGVILEIGSASGRDADFVESLGPTVRRTDQAEGFIEIQASRGNQVERLDVLSGDLGGPHDGVIALCVFLHVAPEATDAVLASVSAALRSGGVFLVSVRAVGDEEATAWSRDGFATRLERAGLEVIWDDLDDDGDQWIVFLAQKA